jgi:hypothetical protein
MVSLAEAELLYEVARQVRDGFIVEVGSYRGRSTAALALGSQAGNNVPVYAIEPHEPFLGVHGGQFGPEDRAAFYRAMLRTGCYRTVRLINLSSEHLSPTWMPQVGLLFLDGDHSATGIAKDWQQWHRRLTRDCTVVFDDCTPDTPGVWQFTRSLTEWSEVAKVGKMALFRLEPAQLNA